jgi:hypothetical protein
MFSLSFSPAAIPCDIPSALEIVEGVNGVSFLTVCCPCLAFFYAPSGKHCAPDFKISGTNLTPSHVALFISSSVPVSKHMRPELLLISRRRGVAFCAFYSDYVHNECLTEWNRDHVDKLRGNRLAIK